jgi:transcriptional regulator with XRE-family HTH domain
VAHRRLQHYLRTYRRRFGFSQGEIAKLLGSSSDTKVSRYENFRRNPSVITVFTYEVIFNEPVKKLFAGSYDAVLRDVHERAGRLIKTLESKDNHPRTLRKLQLLRTIVESKPNAANVR